MAATIHEATATLSVGQASELAAKAADMILEMFAAQATGAHGTYTYNGHNFRVRAYIGPDNNSLETRVIVVD